MMSPKLPSTAKDAGTRLGLVPRKILPGMKNGARKGSNRNQLSPKDLESLVRASGLDIPSVLTVKEAALWMGVHPKTIRRWIGAKILKARKFGRIYRIRRVDLEALFNVH